MSDPIRPDLSAVGLAAVIRHRLALVPKHAPIFMTRVEAQAIASHFEALTRAETDAQAIASNWWECSKDIVDRDDLPTLVQSIAAALTARELGNAAP